MDSTQWKGLKQERDSKANFKMLRFYHDTGNNSRAEYGYSTLKKQQILKERGLAITSKEDTFQIYQLEFFIRSHKNGQQSSTLSGEE